MRFLSPEHFVWFAALPFLIAAWVLHGRTRARFRRAALPPALGRLSRLTTWRRDLVIGALAVIAFAATAFALSRPQILLDANVPQYAREDLVIVLDHSASMGARDVPPSRFARAVQEIKTFLRAKPEIIDRVGLVEFSGTSLILSHLTTDVDSLSFYLDWIRESPEVRYGTDIGSALASARELVRKDNKETRKVFLIISDGADQGTSLAKELAAVVNERTRVYTVGVGADPNVIVPVVNADGVATLLENDEGQPLTAGFDESTLRDVAAQTGGRYVRSTTGADLGIALQDLVRRERPLLAMKTTTEYRDIYRHSLLVGAVSVGLLLLLL